MNLIESPILPDVPVFMGWAAPLAIHLLGLAIAVTLALWLSRPWWDSFFRGLGNQPLGPRYSVWLALVALAVAYALEYVFLLLTNETLTMWLLEAMYRKAKVTDTLFLWLAHSARMLPYVLAAIIVPRLSRPREASLRFPAGPDGWASVRPAFLTLVPWAVVLLLVFGFPGSSFGRAASLSSFAVAGTSLFLTNLLFIPFFLGVLMPALGRALQSVAGLGSGDDGSSEPSLRAGLRVLTLVLGVGAILAWALLLPRPGLAQAGVTATLPPLASYVYYGLLYLIAAAIQDRDRCVLFAPLGVALIAMGAAAVPALLAVFFQW